MGLNVILMSKAPIGASSCTLYVGGGFRAAFGSYTKEDHFNDTLYGGRMINDRSLVRVLVEEAPSRLLELRDFGVNLNIGSRGAYVGDGPLTAGLGLIKPLINYAKEIGVIFLENSMALDLIVDDSGVHGLIVFQIPSGKIIPIYSKSIVLSTGGYSQIFLRSDNPVRVSGDGCAMALKAGAKLVDMEFTQFFPLGLAEEGKPPWLFPAYDAKIINRAGEDVLLKYKFSKPLGKIIVEDRDLFSRALFKEIDDGLGFDDSLIMDIEDKDPSIVMPDSSLHLIRVLGLSGSRFRIAPTAHFTMGGILIDENCSTGVPGLYACGEVCGGVHGANRLGGNALTETIVFGARAGVSASKYALTSKILKVDCSETIHSFQKILDKSQSGSHDIDNLRFELRHSMWKYCGVIRNGNRLRDLLKIIDELNVKVDDATVKSRFDALKLFELRNMLLVSYVVAISSLIREESRGAHYRSDFPNESDGWLKRIYFGMKDGKLYYGMIILT